jgi:hypothetical protein
MTMRTRTALISVLTFLAWLVPGAVAPAGAAPYCGITWGSNPEGVLTGTGSQIVDVRAGQHDCFDRLVIDFAGKVDSVNVGYVPVVYGEGNGLPIPLRGGATLQVYVLGSPYDPETGNPTFTPSDPEELVDVTGWRTFRQIALAGSFEGYTNFGLGVRALLPFRVLILDGPGAGSRIVVDVAHRW